jgi:two-component system phosphate regulon sensor histidine kinase PhoR
MHTQTLDNRELLTRPSERASTRQGHVRTPLGAWSTRKSATLTGGCFGTLLLVDVSLGYFAGWPGVAIGTILVALVVGTWALMQLAHVERNVTELRRLAELIAQTENLNVASFDLNSAWREIGQAIIESHGSLHRRLRDKQAALQKLELSQSLILAAQRRAEAIVDGLTDAVLVTNSFGELTHANPEAERLMAFQLDKSRGKPIRQVITSPALASAIEHASQRGNGTQRHSEELSIASGDKPIWLKVTVGDVLDNATERLGIVTVLRDITKEKAAQARSAEFVSAVSHEIKTPLASVKAYAEMLADGDADGDPETQQKFLNIIEVQTDRMTRLLDGMLDMARIESGVVRVEKKFVSLNELIEGGVKLMQPAASDKNISVEARLSSLYLGVNVDSDMMSRVVMNLISNAIKYTDAGGRIIVRSLLAGDQLAFEVEDTGRGIPAEAMPKLFQKFYRVKENANVAPGTGLGLSLVKHIVEEVHGGRIEVESQVGKGSVFRVRLPLDRVN